MWHVSTRSGVATLQTAIHLLLVTYFIGWDASPKGRSLRFEGPKMEQGCCGSYPSFSVLKMAHLNTFILLILGF